MNSKKLTRVRSYFSFITDECICWTLPGMLKFSVKKKAALCISFTFKENRRFVLKFKDDIKIGFRETGTEVLK
jgi:hypothetical protein